jgi:HEAT repeat protein
MSRNKRIVVWATASLLLLAIAAAVIPGVRGRILGWFRGEPFFDGLPVSIWSERLEHEALARGDKTTFEQLRQGGKPAVSVLMAMAFADAGPRDQAQALLVAQGDAAVAPLMKVLKKSSNGERRQAAAMLGAIGPKAKPAVESLVRLLDDDDEQVREAGMTALEKIGTNAAEAVPDLTLILEGKGKTASGPWLLQAARVLGKVGPSARTAVPALTACLKDRHIELARQACLVLGGLGKDAAPAVPALIDILKNREPARDAAANALGMIGPAAKQAVPTLVATLQSTTRPDLREACKVALANMGADARPAVPALLAAFGKAAPIAEIGPAAVPELIQLLASPESADQPVVRSFLEVFRKEATSALVEAVQKDKNPRLRCAVASLMGPPCGDANRLVPPLIRALEDVDETVRVAARNSIVAFRKEAQPFLDQQLRGKTGALRLEAIQLLGRLGIEARSSARFLLLVLKEETPALHLATVQALAQMGYHPKEAVPVLIGALKAAKQPEEMLALLGTHGRGARDATLFVCDFLKHGDWKLRRQAAFTVGQIGLDKDVSLPALTKALADKNELVRSAAARALGSTRLLRDDVMPILVGLLSDPSEEVQWAAILSLGRFGSSAKTAVPLIHKIARATGQTGPGRGEDSSLRAACVTTLGSIGPPAQEAAPLLLTWLAATTSEDNRLLLVEALGDMQAKEAAGAIEPLMRGKGKLGAAAALALWRIQRSPAALAFLHDGLQDKAERQPCVAALGKVGPAAGKAVPVLIEILMRDPDMEQRVCAADALGRLGAVNARPALKALLVALRAPEARLRAGAARALAQFAEDARDASPRLADLLNDPESPQVRAAAAEALIRIDPDAAADAGIL